MDPWLLLAIHAVVMVATWGIMVPVSLVITRFFKVMPGQNFPEVTDNNFWMRSHRALSVTAVVLSTAGAGLAWWALGGPSLASSHGQWGFAVIILGWCQIVIARQRGTHGGPWGLGNPAHIVRSRDQWFGDHYNMTLRRRIFEAVHISTGYATAVAGLVVVGFGMDQFGLDPEWFVAYAGYLLVLVIAYWKFTRDGRRVPTYQSIWGYSSEHPGNRPGDPGSP